MQNPVNQLDYRILISYGLLKSDLTGARTQDPLLKREMLYQLSYRLYRRHNVCGGPGGQVN